MDKLIVNGPCKLNGKVSISRAKNSSLPLMTACLLTKGITTYQDLPRLRDIGTLKKVLEHLGCAITLKNNETLIDTSHLSSYEAVYELVKTMRASILVLGPLVARYGYAKVSLPGGCAIGSRPIDIHLDGLKMMGANIEIAEGYVTAKVDKLKGASIPLKFPSVGATENLVMAASLAIGETIISNAAREPEIVDLCEMLRQMGAKIEGDGTDTIRIIGVEQLNAIRYRPIADRIETATYLLCALATRSEITIEDCDPLHIESVISLLRNSGAIIETTKNSIDVKAPFNLKPLKTITEPYPGFPTDVQAQLMSYLLTVEGESCIEEKIFENRFMHVSELMRLGADIELSGNKAIIRGGRSLTAAPVMCTDLRASAALIVAALTAEGKTEISRVYHLDRGYETLEEKFSNLGAFIERVSE